MDITYLSKLNTDLSEEYKYLLCFVDHFSKYTKYFLLKDKRADDVLKCIKNYINEIGAPEIFQSDTEENSVRKLLKNF